MSQGTTAGSRRAAAPKTGIAAPAVGAVAATAAWAGLVFAAILSGIAAQEGNSAAWAWLAVATLAAVCCFFVTLMCIGRILRTARLLPGTKAARVSSGGRRAKR